MAENIDLRRKTDTEENLIDSLPAKKIGIATDTGAIVYNDETNKQILRPSETSDGETTTYNDMQFGDVTAEDITATSASIPTIETTSIKVDGTDMVPNWTAAYTATHIRQHSILSSLDHTSTATPGAILKADANGLPVDSVIKENSGNVGFGTTPSASAKLDVLGAIRQNLYSLRMSKTVSQPQSATANYIHFKMAIPARTAVTVKAVFVGTHSTTGIKADIELFYQRGDSTSSASVVTMQCNSSTRTLMYTVDAAADELWIGLLNSAGTSPLIGTLYVEILSNKASDIAGSTPRFVADMVTAAYDRPNSNRYIDSIIATPGALLDGAVTINESGADVDFRVESDDDQNAIFVDGASGNTGFGTATPAEKLDVASTGGTNIQVGNTALGDYGRILFQGNRTGSDQTLGALLAYQNSSGSPVSVGELRFLHRGTLTNNKTGLLLQLHNGTALTGVLYVDENGNFGIGTSTPAEKLDVNGNAKAHSFIGSRKLYAAEAPNSYFGIDEVLHIVTDEVDAYVDIDLPANTTIAHMVLDVVVQHNECWSQDYTAILDTWVHVGNNKVETTVRCANQTSSRWLYIDGTLAGEQGNKVRIILEGSSSGATNKRYASVRGQIIEYLRSWGVD